ncbi:MAG: polymerase sigma factor RpoD, partial [Pseudomonadota bacterium]
MTAKNSPDQTSPTNSAAAPAAAPRTVRVVRAVKAVKPEATPTPTVAAAPAPVAAPAAAAAVPSGEPVVVRRGRKPKAASADSAKADTAKKPEAKKKPGLESADDDFTDIEGDLDTEADVEAEADPEVETAAEEDSGEADKPKAKPLRMKVSRAKERALMREFGLDETTLTEEEVAKRRQELKTLIKMGKTRGYLTHQEINDHLP